MQAKQHQRVFWQCTVQLFGLTVLLLALLPVAGCYDGEALVVQAKIEASHGMREEVDLGKYYVTLPRRADKSTTVSLDIHVFTSVPAADVAKLEEQLEKNMHRLRHDTILTLRQAASEELVDPALAALRERVANVARQTLTAVSIDTIGFHHFAVQEQ